MLTEELVELVKQIEKQKCESQVLELKSAIGGCPHKLYDTLSGFSNQDSGGIIVFGIDETKDYNIVGVYDLQKLQKSVTEQCNQMEPLVRAVFTTAEIDGLQICSAEIPGIDVSERPCYYTGKGRIKGSYIRVGDADQLMTDYEIYSYEAFRKHQHDDERPIERANFLLLDQNLLESYVIHKRVERPRFAQLDDQQAYELLNITRDGVPTLASVMNFGIYPQGLLPQLAITALVVPGTEIGEKVGTDSRFLDNKRIEGTIKNMVEDAVSFCQRNMKVETFIDPSSGMRRDRPEYPIEAIREAVLNALIHRDYSYFSEGTPVQLNFFTDRLEIHSPGNLYGRMTVEQLGRAKPDLRNPALAVMTEVLTGAENRYSGIPTIRREMAQHGLPEPVFENRRNEFVVILYNGRKIEEIVETQKADEQPKTLLEFCEEPRSRREIADFLKLKTTAYVTEQYIKPLLNEGKLVMTIPEKPRSTLQKYKTVKN